jgi:hypothetical protein
VAELLVDPDDLRSASGVIGEAASLVGQAFDTRSADLGVPGQAGWSATQTLGSAVSAWGPFLGRTRGSMQNSADNLRRMADTFVEAEWQAAKRQRRAGGVFEE